MENLKERIARLWAPIAGLLGAITAIVQFIHLWNGDQETVTQVLWFSGAILVLISLYLIGFSLKSSPIVTATKYGDLTTKIYAYGDRLARIARILFFLLFLVAIGLGGIVTYRNRLLRDKVVVLIADFDGPDHKNYRVTEQLLSQLSNALSGYDDTIIRPLGTTITEQEGSKKAQDLGETYHADLVIWGWYGVTESDVLLTIHVENLSKLDYLPLMSSNLYGMQLPTHEIKSFQIQQHISSQMTALTLFLGGMIRYEANDYQDAIDRLSNALTQQWPDDLVSRKFIFFYRGLAYYKLVFNTPYPLEDGFSKAIPDFSAAIDVDSEFWQAYYFRAICYSLLNDSYNAEKDYQVFIDKSPQPTNAGDYKILAQIAMAARDDAKAIEYLNIVIDNDPKDAQSLSNRGSYYIKAGEFEKALDDLDRAVKLQPRFLFHYLTRSEIYRLTRKYELALKDKNRALDLYTSKDAVGIKALILYERGLTYIDMSNYTSALDDFSAAIQLSPDSHIYYYDRGLTYLRLEKFESAIQDFSVYLEGIDPNEDIHMSRAHYYRGVAFERLDYSADAFTDYVYAAVYFSNLAKSWHEGGYIDQAEEECKGAIENFQELSDNSKDDLIMQWANATVKAFQSACPSSLVERIPTKNWIIEVATNPIVPGSRMAGIKIGDSMEYAVEHLGNPLGWFRTDFPKNSDCCLMGSWFSGGYMDLYIFFSDTKKEVIGFYLDVRGSPPNSKGVPPVNGVSIGTSEEELLLHWGNPISSKPSDGLDGCKDIIYEGIKFRLCGKDRLINFIEIPGTYE